MRQVILNGSGALVIRSPRPAVEPGAVLVKVQYSLISVGTETAPLVAARFGAESGSSRTVLGYAGLAGSYLGKAIRNPRKAAKRIARIAESRVRQIVPATPLPLVPEELPVPRHLSWEKADAVRFSPLPDGGLSLQTDVSPFGYQARSRPFAVPAGGGLEITFRGEARGGPICIGALDGGQGGWIGQQSFPEGPLDERLMLDAGAAGGAVVVIANAGAARAVDLQLTEISVRSLTRHVEGSYSEMTETGWNVGYSLAGEVIAIGDGVSGLAVGDIVACAGAGQANHAEYVSVRRNLVCRVPKGCDPRWAATTTVGAIALQGVRRANPTLGERIAVLGLGLIGLLTVQMLRASGCTVIGMDLDRERVDRGLKLGMHAGAISESDLLQTVRNLTAGSGVDRVIITAATKSNVLINLAMSIVRRKGVVVIVGDIGMDVDRAEFYRKEVDLLMSTSYGPGRYDRTYEEEGRDYPLPYVRWTMNRNMSAYMDLIAGEQIAIEPLIDRIADVTDAPQVYSDLLGAERKPVGVLFRYESTDVEAKPERIVLRGHRKARSGPANYVLVGAGAFGTTMLVPQMEKYRDRFFLRGIVSRDAVRGGNFARQHGLELLASDLAAVLAEPDIDLVVIATRHDRHAEQLIAALQAGKHVFVEKPLAISWDELDRIVSAYRTLDKKPILMAGFNRRFSPAMQCLKSELQERAGPIVVNYRVNAGHIPLEHWVQGPQGGGRNIGEACHMYDCFRFLTNARVKSIQAASIDPAGTAHLRNDNFTAVLTYEDGSLCTLTYVSVGPKSGLPKERVEVFCDGRAYVIDDYKALYVAGRESALWRANESDKGHSEEFLRLGECLVSGIDAPIDFDELVEVSAVALRVEDLLMAKE